MKSCYRKSNRFIHSDPQRLMLYLFGIILFTTLLLCTGLWSRAPWAIPLIFIASQKFVWFRLFGGSFISPEMAKWVIVTLNVLYGSVFAWGILQLFASGQQLIATALVALLFSARATYNAYHLPRIRTEDVRLARTGGASFKRPLRIAFITDLHISAGRHAPEVERIVSRVNALNPDLILIGGDLIDGTLEDRHDDVAPLANLSAKYGVYGCLGNHEYLFDAPKWAERYTQLGIHILQNEAITLDLPDIGPVTLAGQTDRIATQYNLPTDDTLFLETHAHQDPTTRGPIILMRHKPIDSEKNSTLVDLQLSGHTHGGMLPGLAWIMRPIAGPFIRGWYTIGKMRLLVSTGAGIWDGFPLRIACQSEINLLRIST